MDNKPEKNLPNGVKTYLLISTLAKSSPFPHMGANFLFCYFVLVSNYALINQPVLDNTDVGIILIL
jgi:hypothetical protein